jgi:hypothetical protein
VAVTVIGAVASALPMAVRTGADGVDVGRVATKSAATAMVHSPGLLDVHPGLDAVPAAVLEDETSNVVCPSADGATMPTNPLVEQARPLPVISTRKPTYSSPLAAGMRDGKLPDAATVAEVADPEVSTAHVAGPPAVYSWQANQITGGPVTTMYAGVNEVTTPYQISASPVEAE